MSIGIDSSLLLSQYKETSSSTKADKLKNQLAAAKDGQTDENMMEVCKEFEAYLVERVMKEMKNAMTSNEDEQGEYMTYFGDMMYQEYAKQIADNGELGIAKQLYDSIQNNTYSPVKEKLMSTVDIESTENAQAAAAEEMKKTME